MTALQAVALIVVAVGGTAVALSSDPLRQTLVLGAFGLSVALLFFAFQSPDAALSEIVVSSVGLPVMALLALQKITEQASERKRQEEDEE